MRQNRTQRRAENANTCQQGPVGKSKVAENFWCALTLMLFVVMGSFAAPVALFAILGLPSELRGESEPELLSESARYQFR